jgi:hypothetical protein
MAGLIRGYVCILVRVVAAESGAVGSQAGSRRLAATALIAAKADLRIPKAGSRDSRRLTWTKLAGHGQCGYREARLRTARDAG